MVPLATVLVLLNMVLNLGSQQNMKNSGKGLKIYGWRLNVNNNIISHVILAKFIYRQRNAKNVLSSEPPVANAMLKTRFVKTDLTF